MLTLATLPLAVETGENHSFLPQTGDRRSGKIRRGRSISYRPCRGQCATSAPTRLRVANVMQRKALATVTPRRPSAGWPGSLRGVWRERPGKHGHRPPGFCGPAVPDEFRATASARPSELLPHPTRAVVGRGRGADCKAFLRRGPTWPIFPPHQQRGSSRHERGFHDRGLMVAPILAAVAGSLVLQVRTS